MRVENLLFFNYSKITAEAVLDKSHEFRRHSAFPLTVKVNPGAQMLAQTLGNTEKRALVLHLPAISSDVQ